MERSERINISVTPEFKQKIREMAAVNGTEMAPYIREVMLEKFGEKGFDLADLDPAYREEAEEGNGTATATMAD